MKDTRNDQVSAANNNYYLLALKLADSEYEHRWQKIACAVDVSGKRSLAL